MVVGSENVWQKKISSGQTPPTLRAARQGGTFRRVEKSAGQIAGSINLGKNSYSHTANPVSSSHPQRAGIWGPSVILHHPLPSLSPRNALHPARAGFMSPHGARALCHCTLRRILAEIIS